MFRRIFEKHPASLLETKIACFQVRCPQLLRSDCPFQQKLVGGVAYRVHCFKPTFKVGVDVAYTKDVVRASNSRFEAVDQLEWTNFAFGVCLYATGK